MLSRLHWTGVVRPTQIQGVCSIKRESTTLSAGESGSGIVGLPYPTKKILDAGSITEDRSGPQGSDERNLHYVHDTSCV